MRHKSWDDGFQSGYAKAIADAVKTLEQVCEENKKHLKSAGIDDPDMLAFAASGHQEIIKKLSALNETEM